MPLRGSGAKACVGCCICVSHSSQWLRWNRSSNSAVALPHNLGGKRQLNEISWATATRACNKEEARFCERVGRQSARKRLASTGGTCQAQIRGTLVCFVSKFKNAQNAFGFRRPVDDDQAQINDQIGTRYSLEARKFDALYKPRSEFQPAYCLRADLSLSHQCSGHLV